MPMTVGIAAICEDGKSVVMAADRRVSFDHRTASLYHDSDKRKILRISRQSAIAVTGGITEANVVFEKLPSAVMLHELTTIDQIAQGLRRCCQDIRKEQVEHAITMKFLGIGLDAFSKRAMKNPTSPIAGEVFNTIKQFSFNLLMLLAGVDDAKAHLYTIDDSSITSFQSPGFVAIGSGSVQAMIELSRRKHHTKNTLNETLIDVYSAKREAEFAGGVGPTTDMIVFRVGGSCDYVDSAAVDIMKRNYERNSRPVISGNDARSLKRIADDIIRRPTSQEARESTKPRRRGRRP